MVVALKPGRFYGSGLPRPRFYDDVKYNTERVDAPPPVLDPLLDWAREAHWSMGGLSFHHRRLQGRIEGSIDKLRAEAERSAKNARNHAAKKQKRKIRDEVQADEPEEENHVTPKVVSLGEGAVGSIEKLRAERSPENGRNDAAKKAKRISGGKRKILDEVQAEKPEEENPISEIDPVTPKVVNLGENAIDGLDAPERVKTAANSIRPRRRSARKLGDEFDRVARLSDRKSLPETVPSPLRHRTRESESKVAGTPAAESGSPRRYYRLRRTELSPISS